MDPRIGTALIVLVGVPAVLIGYIYGTELLLRTLPERLKPKVRPWLWLLPALAFLFVFLIYPTIGTIIRSFRDKLDESFVGFANYQTGTMNAFIGLLGVAPVPWLQNDTLALNTFALIGVMAWMWTGFAMVIISASLKSISAELLEAARVEGANEWQVFRGIVFPLLLPTIAVVSTTMIITALKAFDVVYTMTGGNFNTDVVANLMYKQISFGDFGFASAIAVVLLLAIIPIMLVNVRRFQAQEAIR